MREVIKMESDPVFGHTDDGLSHIKSHLSTNVVPFFSIRKLRLIFNELNGASDFEFRNFDAFKHQVMSSVAPQIELNKWQSISSRR